MARTGIQQKRRRYVHKTQQDSSGTYAGGNGGANKGKKYSTSNTATKKTQGYDVLTGEGKERRGTKTGKSTHKTRTTGQKARTRSTNRKNKAKGGN